MARVVDGDGFKVHKWVLVVDDGMELVTWRVTV